MESVGEDFIRAVTDKHLIRLHRIILSHSLLKALAVGIRIQPQVVVELRLHRGNCARGRTIRVLVGIELDQLAQLRLLTRHVGHQVLDERAPEFAHLPFSP